ncbi:flagellar protein [Neorhizobium sp. NPDC001467]|uniref:flagellar protein n=1 Tax=Neorhizobium sp. NPDC001467 TaxID=3390595 RepID=UPI003D06EF58
MIEDDEDVPVKPIRTARQKSKLSDHLVLTIGIVLAGASAFFPWYVFLNEDKFGIKVAPMDHTRDLPPGHVTNVFSVSPLAMANSNKTEQPKPPVDPIDAITTATTSSVGAIRQAPPQDLLEDQPLPGRGGFRLMHVSNGRALIEDAAGMYMVRVGSILPDNSRLATLEQRDGKWVIVTSAGEIYSNEGTSRP